MEIANGTEADGVRYRVYLAAPNWIAEAHHPDGRRMSESWRWICEPVFGPDAADLARGDEVLTKLIEQLRG